MHHRRMSFVLLAAGTLGAQVTPALAVESASCAAGGEPHAGRQFTLSANTSPLTGDFTYRWDLDHDGTLETDSGRENSIKTEKPTPGTYRYAVKVTDNDVPAGQPGREADAICDVKVVNDLPTTYFEMHPVSKPGGATAYEATRFTFSGNDSENDLEEKPLTHAIDFNADGQFEFTSQGGGEVFASFPAGFDKTVVHRVTDAAGGTVDKQIRVTTSPDPFGIGDNAVLGPLAIDTLPAVTASAPKSIKRKALLKGKLVAKFTWGPAWGRVEVIPYIGKKSGFDYDPAGGYAPGQQMTIRPFPPQLKKLARPGKKLQLRWTAKGKDGGEQTGTIVVKIKR